MCAPARTTTPSAASIAMDGPVKFRDKIRVYNDCHAGDDETPEAYASRLAEELETGQNLWQLLAVPCRVGHDNLPMVALEEVLVLASLCGWAVKHLHTEGMGRELGALTDIKNDPGCDFTKLQRDLQEACQL